MEKEFIIITMVQNISEIGRMINNMDKVKKFGLMALNLLANIMKEKNKGMENFIGKMDPIMMAVFMKIQLMEMVYFFYILYIFLIL